MEASRLVFVSLRGSKPRRKVAVPVPDGFTYEQFAEKVKLKLKLLSVGSIYHVSTGEKLTNIDDLQDIDELLVEEAPEEPLPLQNGHAADDAATRTGAASTSTGTLLGPNDRTSSTATASAATLRSQPSRAGAPIAHMEGEIYDDEDTKKKYVKRNAGIMRRLQRLFPSLLGPGLPVSSKDLDGSKRRRPRSIADPRNFLILFALLSCVATMMLLYSRVSAANV